MSTISNFTSEKDLLKFFKDRNFKKILIITGQNSYYKSGAESIVNNCIEKEKQYFYFKKNFSPNIEELKEIIIVIKKLSPDLILAIGGGCVIDYAKIANCLLYEENLKNKIKNTTYKIKKNTELAAIPTTAGSGAEVTSNAVIYIDNKKYSIEGKLLIPDYFFLIPELVIGSSKEIKASSGFDAIAQSLESLISKKSNEHSVAFAKKSLEISLKYYLEYLSNPNYLNASSMSLAANLSGRAISISKTTAPHAVSYPFTSFFNISHGHAVSLTLDKFMAFNFNNIKYSKCDFNLEKRFNDIFKIAKCKNIAEFINYLKFIKKKANLEDNFEKLGIDITNSYEKIASGINLDRLKNNPVIITKEQLKEIILNF